MNHLHTSLSLITLALASLTSSSQGLVIIDPCCTVIEHREAAFGPTLASSPVAGALVATANASDACEGVSDATPANESLLMIPRGGCAFGEKVLNAQAAGAVGVIVYETQAGETGLVTMAADPTTSASVNIPAAFVSFASGQELIGMLENSTSDALEVVLNTTGATNIHRGKAYDFQMYSILLFAATGLLSLTTIVLVLTTCCHRRKQRQTTAAATPVGEYSADDISGGGVPINNQQVTMGSVPLTKVQV